jgi:chromosome segregation ATPase
MLVDLAQDTLRQVQGQHKELTREVASIHKVLKRLRRALANPDFLLDRAGDDRKQDLDDLSRSCEQIFNAVNLIVTKYDHRNPGKLWSKAKFQPDELQDLANIKVRLSAHKSAIRLTLNQLTSASASKLEKELDNLQDLEGITEAVAPIASRMASQVNGNESDWTSYRDDDVEFWKGLRRELNKKGYSSPILRKHEHLIKQYLIELGQKGVRISGLTFSLANSNVSPTPCTRSHDSETTNSPYSLGS